MTGQVLSAVIGVFAFAILFHAPRRSYGFCALCGGISWAVYLLCAAGGMTEFLCGAIAVFVLTYVARVLSVAMELPATTFVVCGIFPIVPGAGIYHTAYGLMTGNMAEFSRYGTQTAALSGAIALGIIIGMGIPNILTTLPGRALRSILPRRLKRNA